jgi:predicted MFS family arabinose efflux permease
MLVLKQKKELTIENISIEHCNLLHIGDVKMGTIMKNKEAALALIASAVGMYNMSFFSPFLSTHLSKDYNFSDTQVACCFLLASIPYFCAVMTYPFLTKKIPRKLQFVICFCFSALAFLLMGPSKLLRMPNKAWLLLVGLFILGFVQALVFIPTLPEAIDCIQVKYLIVEGFDTDLDGKLSDCIASLYAQLYNLAALVGPVLGGALCQLVEYQYTMDIHMFAELIVAILFAVFNCGLKVKEEEQI